MVDRNEVMKALGTVMDPELGADLVTLGMIRDLNISDDGKVKVVVSLTVPGCPMKNRIGDDVKKAVGSVPGVSATEVSFDSMSEMERASTASKAKEAQKKTQNPLEKLSGKPIKHIIAIGSGKGGVGKSLVSALTTVALKRMGYKVGILDADITGPSIPMMFGQKGLLNGSKQGVSPRETKTGIKMVSMNLLVPDPTLPVIWRGPVLAGVLRQFYTDIDWGELDYLVVDLPPGTADIPLTVFQIYPLDGMVVVTSPQELANMVVTKALKMAEEMKIPLVGIVENMTHFTCPDGKMIEIFGPSRVKDRCKQSGVNYVGGIAIDPTYAGHADTGTIEDAQLPDTINTLAKAITGK
ncbi:MAG: P-loop NTPase [Caldisericia bacterium]|nr:P-loop NTPase [Caldisericia bacterium]